MSFYPSGKIQLRGIASLITLRRAFRNNFKTVPRPFLAVWESTDRCNSRCRYCSTWQSDPRPPSDLLSEPEMIDLLGRVRKIGAFGLVITGGGEPILRPDLGRIIRAAKNLGLYVAVTTNGTLISHLNVGDLRRADLVTVSIDDLDPDIYASRHGIPGPGPALQGFELLAGGRPRPYLTVQAVLDGENWARIDRLNEYFYPRGIDTVFQLVYGRNFEIPPREWEEKISKLRYHSSFTRLLHQPFLKCFPGLARGQTPAPCFAGSSHFVISPIGEFRLCNNRYDLRIDLRKNQLDKLWPDLGEVRREVAGPGRKCSCGNSCFIPPAFLVAGRNYRPKKTKSE